MEKFAERLERAAEAAANGMAMLSVFSLWILTAVVTFAVIMRYVFNDALTWADEISTYCLVSIVFFGLAHTLHHGGHIRIDILTNLFPRRVNAYLQLMAYFVGIVFSVVLIFGVFHRIENFYIRHTESFTELYTPLYIPALPLLIGSVMFLLMMAAMALKHIVSMALGE